ncbi:recombinase family protein [Streptomyces virginiae]|uniref:recombinase family protein n=1 Tax=Streptomyces virginiae TaxID=1961 RepID=UPI002E340337|nr:recombinase family protein [Streptomyces virginiae]
MASRWRTSVSGSTISDPGIRPKQDHVLQLLREGDTLKVTRFDRLSRSELHQVTLGADLRERGMGLHVIEKGINTSTLEAGPGPVRLAVHARRAPARTARGDTNDGLASSQTCGRVGRRCPESPRTRPNSPSSSTTPIPVNSGMTRRRYSSRPRGLTVRRRRDVAGPASPAPRGLRRPGTCCCSASRRRWPDRIRRAGRRPGTGRALTARRGRTGGPRSGRADGEDHVGEYALSVAASPRAGSCLRGRRRGCLVVPPPHGGHAHADPLGRCPARHAPRRTVSGAVRSGFPDQEQSATPKSRRRDQGPFRLDSPV